MTIPFDPSSFKRKWWQPTGDLSVAELAISIFALASVIVAWFSYCVSVQYTRTAANSFEAEFRPYLSFTWLRPGIAPVFADAIHHSICATFALSNDGNVPAYNTSIEVSGSIGSTVARLVLKGYFLAPHEQRNTSVCTTGNIPDYRSLGAALNNRGADLPIKLMITVSYKGVNQKHYNYYADTSYNNQIESFTILNEGEGEKPGSSPKG